MSKLKSKNIILLVISLVIAVSATLYYKFVCSSGICSYDVITRILSPIESGGYIVTIFSIFFLFLPAKYFNSWFKYIFSWAFPLSVIFVITTRGTGDWLVISKTDVVSTMGTIFMVVTLVFVLAQRFLYKK